MTTTRKGNKKTARTSSSDSSSTTGGVEVGNDSKRPRTDTDTTSASASAKEEDTNTDTDTLPVCMGVCEGYNMNSCCISKLCAMVNNYPSQAVSRDNVNSASESNNAVTAKNNTTTRRRAKTKELPTPVELSKELSKIVSDRYSRDESLLAIKYLQSWVCTYDSDFLKWFNIHGGIVKVLDFLNATMNDVNCKGSIRMDCIGRAADVIASVAFEGNNSINKDITAKIVATLMVCDGIDTLINASEEYTGEDDILQLEAVCSVWKAFRNLTFILTTSDLGMNKKKAIDIFDTGIDIISQLKSIGSGDIKSEILEHVFCTFNYILSGNYVTKKYFQDKDILSKCLKGLKWNSLWTIRRIFKSGEGLIQEAIVLFDSCCDENLLDNSSDYEMILPLLVIALKKFPSNDEIREGAMNMIDRSCSTINDKKIIERSGALEVLAILLASGDINVEAEKDTVRTLIGKIVA